MRPRLIARALAPALLVAACTFSSEIVVRDHVITKPLEPGIVNSFNIEDRLARGFIPEVLEFFAAGGGRQMDQTRAARCLGQALLERGDWRASRPYLEQAYAREGRGAERAEVAWLLSQAAYWDGRFDESARWARIARSEGRGVPEGWIVFLGSLKSERPNSGPAPGTRVQIPMLFGRPELVRVETRINDHPAEPLVFDTGASLSLLTESAADRLGVTPIPDALASAYGLHQVEFPLRFGWAKSVQLGNLTLANVPFGILSDEALTFETAQTGRFKFSGVIGAHVLKDFDWRLEYRSRRIMGVRLDPERARGSKGQNLFIRRLKPMVRASFNQEPWFLFLVDTGSEPTMVTRTGLTRSHTFEMEGTYPMTLEGIGKTRVSWGKTSNAMVGVDRYMVRFKDLVIKEDFDGSFDGVLGSSFLANFEVELRFGAMTLSLERPFDRQLREDPLSGASSLRASR